MPSRRYEELDAIRGLAALSVVVDHHLMVLPAIAGKALGPLSRAVTAFPLHILWDGHAAVLLFFVMSGFVLSLPFHLGTNPVYTRYLIKRICRIYLPYLVAVVGALSLYLLVSQGGISGLSRWFNKIWTTPPTAELLLGHALLVTSFRNEVYDPVLWSLVHEMRISLVFPLLMIPVLKWRMTSIVAGFTAVSLCAQMAYRMVGDSYGDYLLTVHYLLAFVLGATVARYRVPLAVYFGSLSAVSRLVWVATALVLYDFEFVLQGVRVLHVGPANDYAVFLGSVMLIIGALGSRLAGSALRSRIPVFLGKISYSLYLWHAVVLLTVVNLTYPKYSLVLILPTSIILGLAVAIVAYRWVELPSIALGRWLVAESRRLEPRTRLTILGVNHVTSMIGEAEATACPSE